MKSACFAVILLVCSISCAEAHHRHHHYRHHHHHYIDRVDSMVGGLGIGLGHMLDQAIVGGRPAGCPHAFCGCAASLRIFGHIVPELNLAANWFQFPRNSPAPGMAAVRRHHVFIIEAVNADGSVVAYDGNSGGHLTRIHTVSLAGYVVVDPRGRKYASR